MLCGGPALEEAMDLSKGKLRDDDDDDDDNDDDDDTYDYDDDSNFNSIMQNLNKFIKFRINDVISG
jgi:hypothetical protein